MPGVAAPRCGRFANTFATDMRVVTLAGGTGAAKLLRGLATCGPPRDLTVIGNTGDDTEVWGLHVSPDLDTVSYALAGLLDVERGWGLAGETFNCLAAMAAHGADTWFNLGDRDLATHLTRTRALRDGHPLSTVTARLAADLGVGARILPMSDAPVRTMIRTPGGRLTFQEYFVREKALVEVVGVDYEGAASARPAPGVVEAIRAADVVVVCPSNPVTSVGPILAVPGIVDALRATLAPVVAVSPIVGGAAVSGPAGALMQARGLAVSPLGVAASVRAVAPPSFDRSARRRVHSRPGARRRRRDGRRHHHDEPRSRGGARAPRARRGAGAARDMRNGAGSRLVVAVPVKDLTHAKQRLMGALSVAERGDAGPRDAARRAPRARGRRPRRRVGHHARPRGHGHRAGLGAEAVSEAENRGHTAAVALAQAEAVRRGARIFVTVPGDVPCVTADELRALADGVREGAPIFVPSRSGLGTNGVALAPPDAMALTFGEPSFARHLETARARGLTPRVLTLPGLGLDVDSPEDLAALLAERSVTETHQLVSAWRDRATPTPAPPTDETRAAGRGTTSRARPRDGD